MQHNQRLAVDAEIGHPAIIGEDGETDHVTPERQGSWNIDDTQMSRAETGGGGQQIFVLHRTPSGLQPEKINPERYGCLAQSSG
ncbi:hypothetical protein GCM10010869_29850 [Mesorhizobium tianshanense]|nr:hypothetical protein GCM10010869_29850 [Mesorhizobium tianshanense]